MSIIFNGNYYTIRNVNLAAPTIAQTIDLQQLQENIQIYNEKALQYQNNCRKQAQQKIYVSDRFKKDLFIKTGLATLDAKTNRYTENIKANDAYKLVSNTDYPTSLGQINTIVTNLENIANNLLKFTQTNAQKADDPTVQAGSSLTNSTDSYKTNITYDDTAIKITINGNQQYFYNIKPNQVETSKTFVSYTDSIEQNYILEYSSSSKKFALKKDNMVVQQIQVDENNQPIVAEVSINYKFVNTNATEFVSYNTIQQAMADNVSNIALYTNVNHPGFQFDPVAYPTISSITIDLKGNSITFENPTVGSPGTVNQCMQLLKGTTVIIKNGTLITNPEARFCIQNYCNLILDNVKISISGMFTDPNGVTKNKYALSNNCGTIILRNGTQIHAIKTEGQEKQPVAFDLYYGMQEQYEDGVYVTVEEGVIIDGDIEYGKASRISDENWMDKCVLKVHKTVSIIPPQGYKFEEDSENTDYNKLVPVTE